MWIFKTTNNFSKYFTIIDYWILRKYIEQAKVADFDKLDYAQRRYEIEKLRKVELLRLQRSSNRKLYKQTRKNYRKTEDYIHLTYNERLSFIEEIAHCVSGGGTDASLRSA